jgi:hypothetical protein
LVLLYIPLPSATIWGCLRKRRRGIRHTTSILWTAIHETTGLSMETQKMIKGSSNTLWLRRTYEIWVIGGFVKDNRTPALVSGDLRTIFGARNLHDAYNSRIARSLSRYSPDA